MTSPPIRTEGLTKRYGTVAALDSLSLEVESGEVLGYLGPNGAGKSTTLALLLGLIRPSAGRALIFGRDSWTDAAAIHRELAYVPSEPGLWPSLTGGETLEFLGRVHGSVDRAYRDDLVQRFELDLGKKVRAYSHGNRQKVMLIAALAVRPRLLLLDEPTTGLDPLMEQVFRQCVREARDNGQTVVLSSHVLSEVEAVCDRVAMVRAGRLIELGRLDTLRRFATVRIRAEVTGAAPDLSGFAGVGNLRVSGRVVECDVQGDLGPVMRVLADAGIRHLTTREPSLEELFLMHYGSVTGQHEDVVRGL
jgi:ABC-2 type transport system ATP-binding protein